MRLPRGWTFLALLATGALLYGAGQGPAAPPGRITVKEIGVEPVNEAPGWMVRVSVDRDNRIYVVGDTVRIKVTSERDGYLYVFNVDAEGNVSLLFPNRKASQAAIKGGTAIDVPGEGAAYSIQVGQPVGKELIWAVVTKEPAPELERLISTDGKPVLVPVDKFQEMLTRLGTGESARGNFRRAISQLKARDPKKYARQSLNWTEHKLEITTVARAVNPVSQRHALLVGVSDFADPSVRALACSHKDANRMEQVLKEECKFDNVTKLLNNQATLARVRSEFTRLVEGSKAGDTVLIYWSGHGGRCANIDGTEADGLDAYLVPHDGKLEKVRESMLLDKVFARWIQELDGRKVMVILDTCHSGGNIAGMKNPARGGLNSDGSPRFSRGINLPRREHNPNARWTKKHFMDTEFIRIKNIGQKDAAVLAACSFKQFAFEREERDLGVMTYHIVEKLTETGTSSLQLKHIAEHVQREVPRYVEKKFPGAPQTPVFSDGSFDPRPFLKP